MDYSKKIDSLTDEQRYLIDYANIKDGLISNQKNFQNKEQFERFLEDPSLGMPLVLPVGVNCFDYSDANNFFTLDINKVANRLFNTKKIDYVGVKNFFKFGNRFCIGAKPKKKYISHVSIIKKYNSLLVKKITNIKKNFKTIGAFQTRNIPHLGHEKIIDKLLEKCEHVIINPVIGPKKEGDFKNNILKHTYEFLSDNFYDRRISYIPICANMHYAGPREAIHHSLLRKSLGFSHFIVGRDHAGAENIYHPNAAFNLLKKHRKKIDLKIITHQGSFYDKKKKKIIIKTNKDSYKNLENISGTDFRKHIKNKSFFKYARKEMQEYLFTLEDNYFINY